MIFVFWYCFVGVVMGAITAMACVHYWGWEVLLKHANTVNGVEDEYVSLNTLKLVFPLLMMLTGAVIWPVIVYNIIARKR